MEYTGCYDSVIEIVDEGTKQFAQTHTLNKNKRGSLRKTCEAIDNFVNEIDCRFVDASVDCTSRRLTVDIGCNDIVLYDGRSDQFFALIKMVDSFSFSKTKKGGLCVALNIDGMWERSQHG